MYNAATNCSTIFEKDIGEGCSYVQAITVYRSGLFVVVVCGGGGGGNQI